MPKFWQKGCHQIQGIEINPEDVQTNIVIFHTTSISAQTLVERLREKGVAVLAIGSNSLRAVTNLMIDREQIQQVPSLVAAAINAK